VYELVPVSVVLTIVQLVLAGTSSAMLAIAVLAVLRLLLDDWRHHRGARRPAVVHRGPLPNEERIGWEVAAYLALEAQENART
jgi:hypothetical protein